MASLKFVKKIEKLKKNRYNMLEVCLDQNEPVDAKGKYIYEKTRRCKHKKSDGWDKCHESY